MLLGEIDWNPLLHSFLSSPSFRSIKKASQAQFPTRGIVLERAFSAALFTVLGFKVSPFHFRSGMVQLKVFLVKKYQRENLVWNESFGLECLL